MVQRFASNVGKSGLFIPTKSLQPIGADIKFELRLANDTPVLVGLGRVKHVRPPDPANPKAAFGMAIELQRVTRESREVILRMLERRKALGLAEVAIPLPDDVESAKRSEVETQPRIETSGIVREAMAQIASAPVSEQILTPRIDSAPVAMVSPLPSGPVGVAKVREPAVAAVAPLGAEPVRAKRPRPADIIAKVGDSGPVAPLPGLDDQSIDVAKVIARARALAAAAGAGELEAELEALKEQHAAPVEIGVEAASAELARQLGGVGVARRERSARWVPPPAVTIVPVAKAEPDNPPPEPAPEPARVAPERGEPEPAAPEPEPAAPIATVETQRTPAPKRAPTAPITAREQARASRPSVAPLVEAPVAPEPAATEVETAEPQFEPAATSFDPGPQARMLIDDDADLAAFENALDAAILRTGATQAAPPGPNDDEIGEAEQLDSMDIEPVYPPAGGDEDDGESTMIGQMPVAPEGLEASLDAHLAAAEAEAAADNYADPQGDYIEPAAHYAEAVPEQLEEEESEEISDLDVLAEADAEDADLLDSHGEAEASQEAPAYQDPAYQAAPYQEAPYQEAPYQEAPYQAAPYQEAPPSEDFASRLALDDGDEFDDQHAFQREPEYARRKFDHDQAAVPPPPSDYDPPSGGYTVAENFPRGGDGMEFDEPHGFAPRAAADPDLENALEQLDVDDLDVSARQSRPRLPGLPSPRVPLDAETARPAALSPRARPTAQPARPRRVPTEDDGVMIDFDDDE